MQNPAEYKKYAEECERMAKEGPQEHRAALLKIAEAWRNCAFEIERSQKDAPISKTGIVVSTIEPFGVGSV
jgi:hypothetical protein